MAVLMALLLATAGSPAHATWSADQPAGGGLAKLARGKGLGLDLRPLVSIIDCGDTFSVAVTVQDATLKRAKTNRYTTQLHIQVSDGAYAVESSIPGPPPLATPGPDFSSMYLWTLPKGASSTNEYRIIFLSDVCPPPAQLNLVATLMRLDAKAEWTKRPQSANITRRTTVSTEACTRGCGRGRMLAPAIARPPT